MRLLFASVLSSCAIGPSPDGACDAVTAASEIIYVCDGVAEPRCEPLVGGPLYDESWATIGCDVSWNCPDGQLGFMCTEVGTVFTCTCLLDGTERTEFAVTRDPCTRVTSAIDIAQSECGWDVP